MIHICIICTSTKPSLLILSDEHRHILEAIVSPTLNLEKLNSFQLWICEACHDLIRTVETFRNIALVGASHLLTRLDVVLEEQDELVPHADPPLSPIKQEIDDSLEFKTLADFDIADENEEPAVSMPVVRLPTLVVHPLTPAGSSPGDRQTDNSGNPQLATSKKAVKIPTLTLHPLKLSSRIEKEEDKREKEELDHSQKDAPLPRRGKMTAHCGEKNDANSQRESVGKTKSPDSAPRRGTRRPPGAVRCGECYIRFTDQSALDRHIQRQHKETQDLFVCEVCKKEFKSKYKHRVHEAWHRKKEAQSVDTIRPELFCSECRVQFHATEKYKAHMKSMKHTPRDTWQFKCDTCGKMFFSKNGLKSHVDYVHLKKSNFQCQRCLKLFPRRSRLLKHVETVHEGKEKPRPHVCHVCGAAFMVKRTLLEHLGKHSDVRPYACPLCPATFKYKAALFTHNRLKHLKIKGNWKKKEKRKQDKKEQKDDAESPGNAIELQIGN